MKQMHQMNLQKVCKEHMPKLEPTRRSKAVNEMSIGGGQGMLFKSLKKKVQVKPVCLAVKILGRLKNRSKNKRAVKDTVNFVVGSHLAVQLGARS
ncbi:hypothetical protein BpHYR1_019741 [Brachionus plicatilis]|uniref:Uncharacterized protein n=1 Tax=Brachionus plicatilis TaxID=10195 RepID=A0A3M7RB06_BRAPC|nr:hypothetical protein BpHYR1_019741 [Brachionus plicatilis]